MHFSPLSKYVSTTDTRRIRLLTWLMRLLVGATFIVSGFAKSIDPWGTLYKTEDYLAAMGLHLWPNLVVVGVFLLCGIEFFIGVSILLGCFRRGAARLCLAVMCFMLPLSLWIAVFDPVDDCGCFGDAFQISNWATFFKNLLLTAMALWLVKFNIRIPALITPAIQWIAALATLLFVGVVELTGFLYQPLIDFRPYKVGTTLGAEDSATEPEYVFVYRKGERTEEFSIDSLPDESEGWEFVERKEVRMSSAPAAGGGFHLWQGDVEVSDEALAPEGDRMILLMPDLRRVSAATRWKINSLRDWATANHIDMIAAVAGSAKDIAYWEDLSMPEYPVYTADDTAIKELARGNPAVVFTRDGKIMWKSSLRALDTDDFMSGDVSADPMSFARDDRSQLRNLLMAYLSVMVLLIMCSILPNIRKLWK